MNDKLEELGPILIIAAIAIIGILSMVVTQINNNKLSLQAIDAGYVQIVVGHKAIWVKNCDEINNRDKRTKGSK